MADGDEPRPPGNNDGDVKEEELDASIEADIRETEPQDPDAMNLDHTANQDPDAEISGYAARIPAKKDANLREFLGKMDEFAPIVSLAWQSSVVPKFTWFSLSGKDVI